MNYIQTIMIDKNPSNIKRFLINTTELVEPKEKEMHLLSQHDPQAGQSLTSSQTMAMFDG